MIYYFVAGEEKNFARYRNGQINSLQSKYDLNSIMHYGRYTFSKNGKPTIAALNKKDKHFGQRDGLSTEDIIQLNLLYRCKGIQIKTSIQMCVLLKKSNIFWKYFHPSSFSHAVANLGTAVEARKLFSFFLFCHIHPPAILYKTKKKFSFNPFQINVPFLCLRKTSIKQEVFLMFSGGIKREHWP